jgi:hypothetical protein
MKAVCVYCATEGKPAQLRQKEPLNDPRVTHGICVEHQRRLARTAEEPPHEHPRCVRAQSALFVCGPVARVVTPQEASARLPTRHAETDCLSVPR